MELPPLLLGLGRTVFAALLILPLLPLAWPRRPRDLPDAGLLSAVALGSLIAFPALFSLGVGLTSAAHAGLILAALPLPTGLFGALFERRLPPRTWWLGAGIALAGESALIGSAGTGGADGATLEGDLLVAIGALAAAFGHVAGARLTPRAGAWPTTLLAIATAGLLVAPYVGTNGRPFLDAGPTAWAAVVFLTLGSTLTAFAAWYFALARGGIARIGALQFLQPPVTVVLASLMLGEAVTVELVASGLVILGGVWLCQRPGRLHAVAKRA